MARPQADGYDIGVILDLAHTQYDYLKRFPIEGAATMFGDCVTLRDSSKPYAPYIKPAPHDHRNIAKAASVIESAWPEMHAQIAEGLEWFEPLIDENFPDDDQMGGCTSGTSCDGFGGICVTVQGVVGCAEGIVHEFGHMKLHAMGVHLLDWSNIVGNDPSELFESPIRKDITRPMGAVLQAQYSYIHVLHLDLALRRLGIEAPMLDLNHDRMRAGKATLDQHFRAGANGEDFMRGLNEWTEELFADYA
jgi:HEXXH motif-containing protein